MLRAFVTYFLEKDHVGPAAAFLLCFGALLRIGEALKLTWENVALPGDVRQFGFPPATAGVNIVDAKTSKRTSKFQFVLIYDPDAILFLQKYHAAVPSHSRKVLPSLTYASYASAYRKATAFFGTSKSTDTSHSCRIRKALDSYISGRSVEQIAVAGRWKLLPSLRYYLENGRTWVLDESWMEPQKRRNHALPWFGRLVSEMALTPEKGKSSGGSPGKRKRDPAEAGGSVATTREAARKPRAEKGPTNGVTEGSSGSCRRHAQRKKQPGQRLMHSVSSEISDSGNERINKRESGVILDGKQQTNKKGKGEAQAPERVQTNGVWSRSADTPG